MGLFGNDKKPAQKIEMPKSNTTASSATSMAYITKCMKIRGELSGCGTLHIDGEFNGTIKDIERLIIGVEGKVSGDIEAQSVMISGSFQGVLECNRLEVMQGAKCSHTIHAGHALLDGIIDGDVLAQESILVGKHGKIETKSLQSKEVTVQGSVHGKLVASEKLEISESGVVQGEIVVKSIKVDEGGKMLGSMSTYDPNIRTRPTTRPSDTHTPEKTPTANQSESSDKAE
jgi:cytoskeletal protein CcmA (bactofilin family)